MRASKKLFLLYCLFYFFTVTFEAYGSSMKNILSGVKRKERPEGEEIQFNEDNTKRQKVEDEDESSEMVEIGSKRLKPILEKSNIPSRFWEKAKVSVYKNDNNIEIEFEHPPDEGREHKQIFFSIKLKKEESIDQWSLILDDVTNEGVADGKEKIHLNQAVWFMVDFAQENYLRDTDFSKDKIVEIYAHNVVNEEAGFELQAIQEVIQHTMEDGESIFIKYIPKKGLHKSMIRLMEDLEKEPVGMIMSEEEDESGTEMIHSSLITEERFLKVGDMKQYPISEEDITKMIKQKNGDDKVGNEGEGDKVPSGSFRGLFLMK